MPLRVLVSINGGSIWLNLAASARRPNCRRVWAFFKRPSTMSWSVLVVAGGVAGIVFWGGFNWALELTST
jgi:cytochrome c-type protein NapC